MADIAEKRCRVIVSFANIKVNVRNQILGENKTMDKKEKRILTKLFTDQDDDLLAILLSKCIITIRPEDKKEKDNDGEKIAM
jgi:hypothetical protein